MGNRAIKKELQKDVTKEIYSRIKGGKKVERDFNQNKQKIKSFHLPTENPPANVLQGFLVHAEHRHK